MKCPECDNVFDTDAAVASCVEKHDIERKEAMERLLNAYAADPTIQEQKKTIDVLENQRAEHNFIISKRMIEIKRELNE